MERQRKKNRRTYQPVSSEAGKERVKRSRKRKKKEISHFIRGIAVVLAIAILAAGSFFIIRNLTRAGNNRSGTPEAVATPVQAVSMGNEGQPLNGVERGGNGQTVPPIPADGQIQQEQQEREEALAVYSNLGIANVSDSLNIREAPGEDGAIIGRLPANGACDILETEGEWSHIRSGKVEGYVLSQYLLSGEEAREQALGEVKEMAIITSDSLNIRSEPVINYANT